MGYNSLILRSPKKEEQQVPDSVDSTELFVDIKEPYADKEMDITDELEGIWGVENEENFPRGTTRSHGQLCWDLMDWEGFPNGEVLDEEEEIRDQQINQYTRNFLAEGDLYPDKVAVKKESVGFWDDDEKRVSLNLNLNYQEVLDAWSDRGPLWADEYSLSLATSGYYVRNSCYLSFFCYKYMYIFILC